MANPPPDPPPLTDPFGVPRTAPFDPNNPNPPPNPYPQNPYYVQSGYPAQGQGQNQQQQGPPPQQGWLPPGPYPPTATGLPPYFKDIAGTHPLLDTGHISRAEFYFVDDGPQKPGETDGNYKFRIRHAGRRMGLEYRELPPMPEAGFYDGGKKSAAYKKASADKQLQDFRDANAHAHKLDPACVGEYDPIYEQNWDAEKLRRQTANAVKRKAALDEVRAHYARGGYDRVPTPEPPDDSGDELYNWGREGPLKRPFVRPSKGSNSPAQQGAPQPAKKRRGPRKKPVPYSGPPPGTINYQGDAYPTDYHSAYYKPKEGAKQRGPRGPNRDPVTVAKRGKVKWPSLANCTRCKAKKFPCNLKQNGPPCSACQRDQAECVPHPLVKRPEGYESRYPHGHEGMFPAWYRDRGEDGPAERSSQRSRSASPRRERSASPQPRPDLGYQNYGGVAFDTDPTRATPRCAQCLLANPQRDCNNSRPCENCVRYGLTCQDWGLDEQGRAMLIQLLNVPAYQYHGGVRPQPQNAMHSFMTQGAMDGPPIQYQQPSVENQTPYTSYQTRPPAGDTFGFGESSGTYGPTTTTGGLTLPSAGMRGTGTGTGLALPAASILGSSRQAVEVNESLDPALFETNPNQFSNVAGAPASSGLQTQPTARQVQEETSTEWATQEPEPASSLFGDDDDSVFNYGDDDGDINMNMDMDLDMDKVDAELDNFDFSIPHGLDPNLPQPGDHATDQDYADLPSTQPQRRQPLREPLYSLTYDDPMEGPVLPCLASRGQQDMLGYFHGCMEARDYAQYFWDRLDEIDDAPRCEKEPTRRCETSDHYEFFHCQDCQNSQYNILADDDMKAFKATQHHYCAECANTLKANFKDYASNQLNLSVGDCDCLKQMRQSTLCVAHRINSIDRVEKRAVWRRSTLMMRLGGDLPCPSCNLRAPEPASDAWVCFSCSTNVVGPSVAA